MSTSHRALILAGRPSEGAGSLDIRSPWSGEVVASVAQAGPAELEVAAASAARAFDVTRRLPAWRRAAILRAVSEGVRARGEELAGLIRDEGGKPIQYARGEVARAVETFRLSAEEATRIGGEIQALDDTAAGEGRHALVRRVPRGPVLAIAPFNFPLNLVAHKVGPAVAAGCPIVVKPAEQTPSAALVLGELLLEAGWPAEALSVLPCDRSVASAMVDDGRFAVISFTGSDVVGWRIRAQAPRAHVCLELGGNAAVIVEPDADLDAAVPKIAATAYAHAGQVCISVQHVLVHRDVYDAVQERFLAATAALPVGDPGDPTTVCGPLIDARAADRVAAWMAEADGAGARRLVGGERQGQVIRPAVYTGVPEDARLSRDEVFGPVAVLRPYADLDEAIRFVNRGRFGLQCGLYTRDVRSLWRAAEDLQVGAVLHDEVPTFRVDSMPYGGTKDSGVGREGPRWAMQDFLEERTLVLRVG